MLSLKLSFTICFSIRYYLSERFRLRFEDSGLEDMMEEEPKTPTETEPNTEGKLPDDEGIDVSSLPKGYAVRGNMDLPMENMMNNGTIRTLDGEMAGDELEGEAINYQILLGKIDRLLDRLKLDA